MNWMGLQIHLPWQTMDNNRSLKNKEENMKISQEIGERGVQLMNWNEFKTKIILKNHIVDWTYQNDGVLIPELEARASAERAFCRYKSCGFIDEWNNIREDLLEYLQ